METENLPSADASGDAEATSGSAPPDAERSPSMTESTDALTSAEATSSTAPLDAGPFAPMRELSDLPPGTEATYSSEPPHTNLFAAADETPKPEAEDAELDTLSLGRSWTRFLPTVLVGILMFVLGGVGGFVGRPYIMPPPPTPTPVAAPQQQPADIQSILALLISKTRHFKGSPNAPVTMLEFADFQ